MSRWKHKIPAAQGETVKGFPASYHSQQSVFITFNSGLQATLSIGMKRKLGNAVAMLQEWRLQL